MTKKRYIKIRISYSPLNYYINYHFHTTSPIPANL